MRMLPPAPELAPALAVIALETLKRPVLLSIRWNVPPLPAPAPLEVSAAESLSVPDVLAVLAVRLMVPPFPVVEAFV